jgi:protein dithiol oxidoreductase (disulfide-forming)
VNAKKLLLIVAFLTIGSVVFFAARLASTPTAPAENAAARTETPAPAPVVPAAAPAATQTESTAARVAAPAPEARVVLAQASAGSDAAAGVSSRFELGKHYTRLTPTQPTSSSPDQVEVAEVFWYGCPHCFNFDPYVEKWLSEKPPYVNFVRIPAVWNPLLQMHARAFYTAEALGKVDEMHEAFFREIHINGNSLGTEAALQEFFGRFGVDPAAFKNAFDSFSVHTKLQRADELARRYHISSVPTVVINGKYVTNATMAGGYDQLMELINELAASEETGA